jgi:hypothetical protein
MLKSTCKCRFINSRHVFDFLPLLSQSPCKGNYCQEDSIVKQEDDLSDRRNFLESALQERDTGREGNYTH